jgi:DNA-binding transcriptional MocR family regulator
MTIWTPELESHGKRLYAAITDAIRRDIQSGRLGPGDRLPPHRELADALGVAVGTVTRAYGEAENEGLVRGEIGRGTFVRDPSSGDGGMRIPVIPDGFVDLSMNFPLHGDDPDLASTLQELAHRPDLADLLRYQPSEGTPRHRRAGAEWARRFGVEASPEDVVVCAGAQHAMTSVLGAVAQPGDRVLVEELTYPGIKGAAGHLHLKLSPVAMDADGLLPDALAAACRQRRPRVLYLCPTLQNPTSSILSAERRERIVEIAREHDLWILEDDVHRRLVPDPPPALATLAPERTFFIAGTSKSVAGGLRVAFLVVPPGQRTRVAQSVWATVWVVPPLCAEILAGWIEDGTAEKAVERKRTEAARRQELARQILGSASYRAHPNGFYLWLELPPPWTGTRFAAAARQRGVGVTPSDVFRVDDTPGPDAVRVCLGAVEDRRALRGALETLAGLLSEAPGFGPSMV